MKNEDLVCELERIRLQDPSGKLRPEAVLDAARPVTSPLHGRFEWDDGEAAERYRLQQARNLIRVAVTVLPNTNEEVRVYHSLSIDRGGPGEDGVVGGYRHVADVMDNEQLQRILLSDAFAELRRFEMKYSKLQALASVLEAARQAREEHEEEERLYRASRRTKKKAKKKAKRKAKKKTTKKKASKKGPRRSTRAR